MEEKVKGYTKFKPSKISIFYEYITKRFSIVYASVMQF